MAKATQPHNMQRARSSQFLIAVNRIRLSQMIRDPFVAAAFRAAEDDGLAPIPVDLDHPKALDGGASEIMPAAARFVTA
ncbi:MAG: hypothetical protein KGL35_21875 [Bradyrhizobium sp.]|uniref:hypothetical protein n=1 Tax=Bradyrhizobium sp. TaxID=376 RepID=UPI001C28C235|nr:hypothetical protein [Bradyrhizobium sp.]MBU6463226.1 hypothetical protein [Pseudomonadota bacterium]MDE2068096.1 hypothetical protein [Bradyrhizobium sp.]MDE2471305.1 hypothetical protein [Bradyrhizobium sp.]